MVYIIQFSFLDSLPAQGKQSHRSEHIYFFIKSLIKKNSNMEPPEFIPYFQQVELIP